MNIVFLLQVIAAIGTILVGLYSLLLPRKIDGFTGVTAIGPRGVTEIRTIFGAVFIGLGAAVLVLNEPGAYMTAGITYLALAVVRTVSMVIDRSADYSNIVSGVVELVFGIVFLL